MEGNPIQSPPIDEQQELMLFQTQEVGHERLQHHLTLRQQRRSDPAGAQSTTRDRFVYKDLHCGGAGITAMDVIPVIDILRGVAVHAHRGERAGYRPIRSVLLQGAEPLALAGAYRRILGSTTAYVADLDAIMGTGDNLAIIGDMAAEEPQLDLLVDAGIRSADEVARLLESGAKKVIIASESMAGLDAATGLLAQLETRNTLFSIDLRDRAVRWRDGSSETTDPCNVAALLSTLGIRDAILLEIERIGTGIGADAAFLGRITLAAPDMRFIVGGGIKTAADLLQLKRAGACGVLLATALHDGTITGEDLARLELSR
jgi:phosphoribosylformimino-5-aminoimidazole carboxamide ribotide isomerase